MRIEIDKATSAPTVYKYFLLLKDRSTVPMPEGAQVLSVAPLPSGSLVHAHMWALVDPSRPMVDKTFYVVGTGHPMPDEPVRYITTIQYEGWKLVFHVFEGAEPADGQTLDS